MLRAVLLICTAQVLVQIGAYTWPALLPKLIGPWQISHTEAGWITGLFYLAYMASVPFLLALTDRIDARRVYLVGVGLTVAAHLGFALWAEGFWTAACFRVIAGLGWAGTYMTGLKLLSDGSQGAAQSRAVAAHAASIGIAGALSFSFAGSIEALLDWRSAFAIAGGTAGVAWVLALLAAPRRTPVATTQTVSHAQQFRAVFRNRAAMAYGIGYCLHTLEMSALRGWAVAFLGFAALASGQTDTPIAPAAIATAMAMAGTFASVGGNELALRLGRMRLIRWAMSGSILCGAVIGFLGPASYALAAGLVVLYGLLIWLDSSSLTAGAVAAADADRRGATLGIYSMLGYAGGFVGPLIVGAILDLAGGANHDAWGWAFFAVAAAMLTGRILFTALHPRETARI